MKYLSVVVFAILLTWTWTVINNIPSVSFETHTAIQSKVAQIIEETIKSKKPEALNVVIDQIWTENLSDNSLIAHFSYKYKENSASTGVTESKLTGTGKLDRLEDDGSGVDRWKLYQIKTSNDSITFEDALVVATESTSAE